MEDTRLSLEKELENYRLDILRAEKAYDEFNNQINQVMAQVMDLEQRQISFTKSTMQFQ